MNKPDSTTRVKKANIAIHALEAEIYDKIHTEIFNQFEQERLWMLLLNISRRTGSQLCLDVGCGTGNLIIKEAKLFKYAVSIDISREVLSKCKEKIKSQKLINADCEKLPFRGIAYGYFFFKMMIQGDTNIMLAAGLAALKLGIRIGHVEAGLRSFDWRMSEEHNRRMIDHVFHYLFAPTEIAKRNLLEEHVWGEVFVTGNTIIDAVEIYFNKVSEVEEKILQQLKFGEYALVTFHRAENVHNPQVLRDFVKILKRVQYP